MQDAVLCLPASDKNGVYGVFDGHGKEGQKAATIARDTIQGMLEQATMVQTIENCQSMFAAAQSKCLCEIEKGGTTALCCFVDAQRLLVANVGDSRCVLARAGKAKDLSTDHCCEREDERKRVEANGGHVLYVGGTWRVDGSLNITRSLGNRELANVLSAVPEFVEHEIAEEDDFVVLATDGVWKVMSSQDCVDVIAKHLQDVSATAVTPVESAATAARPCEF